MGHGSADLALVDVRAARAQLAGALVDHHHDLAERGFSPTPELDADAFDVVGVLDGRYLFVAARSPSPGGEPDVEASPLIEESTSPADGSTASSTSDAVEPRRSPTRDELLEELIDLLAYQPLTASLLRGIRKRHHVERIVDFDEAQLASTVEQVRMLVNGRLQEQRARQRHEART